MRITIPDDLADHLQTKADGANISIDRAAEIVLQRTLDVGLQERFLLVRGTTRQDLETLLGRPVADSADLLTLVTRLGDIRFGSIQLQLRPKHKEELVRRAAKRSMTVQKLVQEIAGEIEPLFFDAAGGFGIGYKPALQAAQGAQEEVGV